MAAVFAVVPTSSASPAATSLRRFVTSSRITLCAASRRKASWKAASAAACFSDTASRSRRARATCGGSVSAGHVRNACSFRTWSRCWPVLKQICSTSASFNGGANGDGKRQLGEQRELEFHRQRVRFQQREPARGHVGVADAPAIDWIHPQPSAGLARI